VAFRVWIDTDIAFELGCCVVRRLPTLDQIFNVKTSTWVALPVDGVPLALGTGGVSLTDEFVPLCNQLDLVHVRLPSTPSRE
jgi:hypothetical protein